MVRQFFYDWSNEVAADLTIECVEAPSSDRAVTPPALDAARVGAEVEALGAFVEASFEFWLDVEEGGRGRDQLLPRAGRAHPDGGRRRERQHLGIVELDDDQALVIEVAPPEALYWSVSLGNFWWETIDYANRQSSLNGHQAVLDPDGVFRAVVAHRDPGVANWLDTAGNHHGAMIFRWLRAAAAPVPEVKVVEFDELDRQLPPSTPRVDAVGRRRVLDARYDAVRRRFPR